MRHAPFALFVGGILAYGAAFAWYLLDRLDVANLIRDVNFEDAFYYFQIAWHMAEGRFSTFDGGLTRTNGYHPLWLFLITPFYWVFDKEEALFAIKAFEIMLVAGGVALVAGAARVARQPWVLLFAALPALYENRALFWGLEAAAALFMLGLFLLAVCLFARDPSRWRWPLAAVAFALPWVRLEYVAISVAAAAALCLVEWSDGLPSAPARRASPSGSAHRPTNPPGVRAVLRRRLRARQSGRRAAWRSRCSSAWRSVSGLNAAAPLAGAVAGILVYFTYNAVVFGGVVPVSAALKELKSQQFWEREGGYSLTANLHAFLQTGYFDDELLAALEVCVYAALVWWVSRRSRGRDDWLLLAFLVGVFSLAAGHLAKFAQSVLTVYPGSSRMDWYFVPAYLLGALAVPARCCVAVWLVRRFLGPEPRRASRIPTLGIVTIGAVCLFAAADFTMPFRYVDSFREETRPDWQLSSRMSTAVMDRLLPEDAVVGVRHSGVTGYFSRFPVMNLDGLVNSWDYLRALRERTADAFLRRRGVTHLVVLNRRLADGGRTALFESPSIQTDKILFRFTLLPAEWGRSQWREIDPSEWFWERMAPHFEHQEDGVGLLVDGRLAQAFSRDCGDGRLAEWTWAGQEKSVVKAWTSTSIGYCASDVVLPHDALPPVRVATTTVREYLAARVGERRPAIDADFDVHLVENRLVYVKEQCGPEDVGAPFFLHVVPVVSDDLPGLIRLRGFDNLDFRFGNHGSTSGACVADILLPDYGIEAIRTGQYVEAEGGFHSLWEGEIRFDPTGGVPMDTYLANRVRGRRPVIDADYDVYLVDGALIYVKEACGPEDDDARFFLHVEAVDTGDLPVRRWWHGFDNLDFRFDARGARFDGDCLAEVPLPEYGIAAVRTGRLVEVEGGFHRTWEREIRFGAER